MERVTRRNSTPPNGAGLSREWNISQEWEAIEEAIAALEAQRDILGDAVVEVSIAALREKLAVLETQRATEQRKQVTVLFADVSGFTAMSETMDPEEVHDIMNALWARLDSAITAHGGTIDKHMGDAVMGLFGAPTAREDDPERAVLAALAMQKEVADFNASDDWEDYGGWNARTPPPRISVRVGVHTGPVSLGTVGTTGEYTAMGDTVNLARRLQEAAPVGKVIISHDTYRHVQGVFNVQPLKPVSVKGKSDPIPIYVVLRAWPRTFRFAGRGVGGIETRMVGREQELARLKDILRAVLKSGKSQVVTIIGEAGVGKSRLLYEFDRWLARQPGTIIYFKGRADEQMANTPGFLIRDLLSFRFDIQDSDPSSVARSKLERGILSFMGGEGMEKAHFIGHLIGFDFSASPYLRGILGDARQIRDRAFHYLTQFFDAVARHAPTVIFLEDIHWADESSLDLIEHLSRGCQDVPLLMVCLARPSLLERRPSWGQRQQNHTRIDLKPLSADGSRQLVVEILRKVEQIPPELQEMIVGRAEGNPFYIEEFIKSLIESGVIVPGPRQWRIRSRRLTEVKVPPTLVGLLQARLDRLSPTERDVLQRASVVGRVFWDGAVQNLCDASDVQCRWKRSELRAVLEALCRRELIFLREESSFAGEQEYAFKHTILHAVTYESVLKRLRRIYHAQVAAWLVERSGERVGEYAGLIGEHYERAGDIFQASGWYGLAGTQARTAYAPEAAIGYYQRALALLPEAASSEEEARQYAGQRVTLYEGMGEMLLWQARYAAAAEAYTKMRKAAEIVGNLVDQARAWNGLSRTQDAQGDYPGSLASADQAEKLCRAVPIQNIVVKTELARALFRKGWACYRLGREEEALSLGQQALALSTELGSRREMAESLSLLGGVYDMLGRHGDAARYNAQAVALYQELGDRERLGAMLNQLGEHARLRGDYRAAEALYQEALTIAYETGNRNGEMLFLSNLGGARVGLGKYHLAEEDLRRTIRWAEIAGPGGWLSRTYCFLAEALLGQGKVAEALAAARRALTLGMEVESPALTGNAWRVLGMVLRQAGRTFSLEGREYDAESCFAESARVLSAMGAEGERARTLWEWGKYKLQQGDEEQGRKLQQEAREIFERLGMEGEARAAQAG